MFEQIGCKQALALHAHTHTQTINRSPIQPSIRCRCCFCCRTVFFVRSRIHLFCAMNIDVAWVLLRLFWFHLAWPKFTIKSNAIEVCVRLVRNSFRIHPNENIRFYHSPISHATAAAAAPIALTLFANTLHFANHRLKKCHGKRINSHPIFGDHFANSQLQQINIENGWLLHVCSFEAVVFVFNSSNSRV